MAGRYASNTEVPADRTRAEIEHVLTRYGATRFAYGWQGNTAVILFEMGNRRIRFNLPLPDKDADEFRLTPAGRRRRSDAEAERAWEQTTRANWRALLLAIKAKLEAVEVGITSFEDEFLAHIVLPGGGTVGEHMKPQIEQAYLTGRMPALLPGLTGGETDGGR